MMIGVVCYSGEGVGTPKNVGLLFIFLIKTLNNFLNVYTFGILMLYFSNLSFK